MGPLPYVSIRQRTIYERLKALVSIPNTTSKEGASPPPYLLYY